MSYKKTLPCYNNIIIITTTMFMVLSSWHSHCESSPGSFDERLSQAYYLMQAAISVFQHHFMVIQKVW